MNYVYIFSSRIFGGGVFSTRERAEIWIAEHMLSGMLTMYPVDIGVWEWALERDITNVKPEKREEKGADPKFVGSFTSGSMDHWHYEEGVCRHFDPRKTPPTTEPKEISAAIIHDWYDGPIDGAVAFDRGYYLFDQIHETYQEGPRIYRLRPISRIVWQDLWDAIPEAQLRENLSNVVALSGGGTPEEKSRLDRALDMAEASAAIPVALAMDWQGENRFAAVRWLKTGESPRSFVFQFGEDDDAWRRLFAD